MLLEGTMDLIIIIIIIIINIQVTKCTNLYAYLSFILRDEHFSRYTLRKLDFKVKLLNKI